MYKSINPYTQTLLAEYPYTSPAEIAALLERMQAYRRSSDFAKNIVLRVQLLQRLADLLGQHRERLAQLITAEMGKPIAQARAEVDKSASVCLYYAEFGPAMLAPQRIQSTVPTPLDAQIIRQPLGVLLQIMPWNFPFWQVFRFAAPALLAGNTIILKHSPNVPQCALAIADLVAQAADSPNVLNTIFADNESVGKLIGATEIRGVSFTGSNVAGSIVASLAGNAAKKSVLELGGSDAFIVCPDADFQTIIPQAAIARLQNNGQTCIASKRFIVPRDLHDAFCEALIVHIQQLQIGDPLDPQNYLSVLARPDLATLLHRQTQTSIELGARCLFAGAPSDNPNYFAPVLLSNPPAQSPAATEELFGPVFSIFSYGNEEEAVALANASRFGLGASVWSQDPARAQRIAEALEVGAVAINQFLKSDPRLPFGGVKDSGYGRELGLDGLLEFVNTKTVVC